MSWLSEWIDEQLAWIVPARLTAWLDARYRERLNDIDRIRMSQPEDTTGNGNGG